MTALLRPSLARVGSSIRAVACGAALLPLGAAVALAQRPQESAIAAKEAEYYRMSTVAPPEGVVLEVGGLETMPDGRLAVATRRGDVWLIENPASANGGQPHFSRFAQGLHEALGLAYRDGSLYTTQRSELTRLRDADGDGKADVYETVQAWPLSGNYHEYSFGPVFGAEGRDERHAEPRVGRLRRELREVARLDAAGGSGRQARAVRDRVPLAVELRLQPRW